MTKYHPNFDSSRYTDTTGHTVSRGSCLSTKINYGIRVPTAPKPFSVGILIVFCFLLSQIQAYFSQIKPC